MQTFYLRCGDNRPLLSATLRDQNGGLYDLTGASVTVRAYNSNGTIKFSGAATGPSAGALGTSGAVEYQWNSSDITPRGRYRLEFYVTRGSAIQTVPNYGDELWLEIT